MQATQRVALVTGASRGIGRAIALALGHQGAFVIGTATTEQGAGAIADALAEAGVAGDGRMLDVTDTRAVDTLVNGIAREHAPVGILVNNAGITRDGLLLRLSDDDWNAVIDTNLSSVLRTVRACARGMMKARWGRVVNIASVVGAMGNAGQSNYSAAKAGMMGVSRSMARELGSRGITVNCVAPGFIDTDMTRGLGAEQREALLSGIPLGKLGQPEQVAAAVAFLASDAAGYITGETLHVNGGMFMH